MSNSYFYKGGNIEEISSKAAAIDAILPKYISTKIENTKSNGGIEDGVPTGGTKTSRLTSKVC